jgi:hypothetical protein
MKVRLAALFGVLMALKSRGKVIKMEWINPHSWIHIAVADEKTGIVNE